MDILSLMVLASSRICLLSSNLEASKAPELKCGRLYCPMHRDVNTRLQVSEEKWEQGTELEVQVFEPKFCSQKKNDKL